MQKEFVLKVKIKVGNKQGHAETVIDGKRVIEKMTAPPTVEISDKQIAKILFNSLMVNAIEMILK